MANQLVLEVKNVSKSFELHRNVKQNLKEKIMHLLVEKKQISHTFQALKNVSFNLYKGEALGIIGENGAGKSTLLRILSGVTQPDVGQINYYGKTVSILDIGAGFHPELSGIENIYLAASLYKFTKTEINQQLNAIISFSGISEFINEPVKNYSSGMYLRLAFSIITCLQADLYIIDEVINVGDANFQSKCKTRMEELMAAGKTLLIASHNMNEMVVLCNRIILMEKGEVIENGGAEVIQKYMARALPQFFEFKGNTFFHLKDLKTATHSIQELIIHQTGIENYTLLSQGIDCSNSFTVFFQFQLLKQLRLLFRLKIFDSAGALVFACSSIENKDYINSVGNYRLTFNMPKNLFNERAYSIDLVLVDLQQQTILYTVENIITVKMAHPDYEYNSELKMYSPGLVKPVVSTHVTKY